MCLASNDVIANDVIELFAQFYLRFERSRATPLTSPALNRAKRLGQRQKSSRTMCHLSGRKNRTMKSSTLMSAESNSTVAVREAEVGLSRAWRALFGFSRG